MKLRELLYTGKRILITTPAWERVTYLDYPTHIELRWTDDEDERCSLDFQDQEITQQKSGSFVLSRDGEPWEFYAWNPKW
jgi:hypothetical protein